MASLPHPTHNIKYISRPEGTTAEQTIEILVAKVNLLIDEIAVCEANLTHAWDLLKKLSRVEKD